MSKILRVRRPRRPVDRHDARPDDRVQVRLGLAGPVDSRVVEVHLEVPIVLVHALALLHARFVREPAWRTAQTVELRGTAHVDVEPARLAFHTRLHEPTTFVLAKPPVGAVVASGHVVVVDVPVLPRRAAVHDLVLTIRSRLAPQVAYRTPVVALEARDFCSVGIAGRHVVGIRILAHLSTARYGPIEIKRRAAELAETGIGRVADGRADVRVR